jgi:hypothetical protein
MAGTIVADNIQAASTSTLVLKNGVANTPPTIQDSGGTEIGTFCRAWVNFNGTGTVAIRASFNVSSITDNGTGDYTVNFTTALPDINYSVVSQVSNTDSGTGLIVAINSNGVGPTYTTAPTTTATRMLSFARATGTNTDAPYVCVSVFR